MKNWYIVPAPTRAGTLRRIKSVSVVDSFGVVTELDPAENLPDAPAFDLFAISDEDGTPPDGRLLFTPNIAGLLLDCDLCEEVRFGRDEGANLVWAHEHTIVGKDGYAKTTGTERVPDTMSSDGDGSYYTLKTDTARAFIPYVPRQTAQISAVDGDIAQRPIGFLKKRSHPVVSGSGACTVSHEARMANHISGSDETATLRRKQRAPGCNLISFAKKRVTTSETIRFELILSTNSIVDRSNSPQWSQVAWMGAVCRVRHLSPQPTSGGAMG